MKTKFSIITFYDPFGDGKSPRREFSRTNFETNKTLEEVRRIILAYNDKVGYYKTITLAKFDKRRKIILDFDNSHFNL
jgi:hypothetical protein